MDSGLSIPEWAGRRRSDALRQIKAAGQANNTPCDICGQAIDYSLEYPHPQSCSVQHVKSRKLYPSLTWEPSNWRPSHSDCNKSAGVEQPLGLGVVDGQW